jgi:HSP20 family protein
MVLKRWEPFAELRQMQEHMDRLWHNFFPSYDNGSPEMEGWAIPMDVVQEGDNILVHASLSGIHPDDINVSLEDNVSTIKAQTRMENESTNNNYLMHERRLGSFHRSLRLPDTVDTDQATTNYQYGVLTIAFPKVESKQARQLKVTASSTLESGKS